MLWSWLWVMLLSGRNGDVVTVTLSIHVIIIPVHYVVIITVSNYHVMMLVFLLFGSVWSDIFLFFYFNLYFLHLVFILVAETVDDRSSYINQILLLKGVESPSKDNSRLGILD